LDIDYEKKISTTALNQATNSTIKSRIQGCDHQINIYCLKAISRYKHVDVLH